MEATLAAANNAPEVLRGEVVLDLSVELAVKRILPPGRMMWK
jgi:hypothetical protein